MNSNAFAKGDALAKLIELIGADNKAFKAQDAELLSAINEVREMFNSDELTVCSWDELAGLASAGQLEPGHAYKINEEITVDGKNLVNLIVQAKSNTELKTVAIADGYLVHIKNEGYDAIHFDDLVKLITEGSKDPFTGSIATTNLSNLPVTKSTVNVEVSADGTLSWAEGLEAGQEVLAVIHNTGGTDINIILPDNSNEDVLTIPAGEYSEVSVVNVNGTYYTRVPSTTGAVVDDDFIGSNEVTTLVGLPVDKSTINAEISADETLSWSEGLVDGREVLCIIHNTGSNNITISLPANSNTDSVSIGAGEYLEAAVAVVAGTYYTRVSIEEVILGDGGSTNDFAGTNNVTTLENIPVNKSTVKAEISTNQALSWAEGLANGFEVLAIINNTGSNTLTISLPENCNTNSINIAAGEYIEAAVVAVNGTYYTRVSVEEVASGSGSGSSTEYEEITAADVQAMFDGTYGN